MCNFFDIKIFHCNKTCINWHLRGQSDNQQPNTSIFPGLIYSGLILVFLLFYDLINFPQKEIDEGMAVRERKKEQTRQKWLNQKTSQKVIYIRLNFIFMFFKFLVWDKVLKCGDAFWWIFLGFWPLNLKKLDSWSWIPKFVENHPISPHSNSKSSLSCYKNSPKCIKWPTVISEWPSQIIQERKQLFTREFGEAYVSILAAEWRKKKRFFQVSFEIGISWNINNPSWCVKNLFFHISFSLRHASTS